MLSFSYFAPYIPNRTRLQAWRNMGEIMFLRALTALIRTARREAWRMVILWSVAAAAAGLAAGFAGALLLAR
jgi:hypothetical protein